MEEKKNANQPQEIRDEELDHVCGGNDPTLNIKGSGTLPWQRDQTTDSAAPTPPDSHPQASDGLITDNQLGSGSGYLCDSKTAPCYQALFGSDCSPSGSKTP